MKVLRILIVAAVLALAAITQLQAQPAVETITVDTLVNLGKTGGGEATGAFFLPDGNIIAMWKDTPNIIDSKSGEVIRKLESLEGQSIVQPELSSDGSKLVAISMGPKLKVWDVISGKIVFEPEKEISYFCISPDGTRLFVTLPNNKDNPGIIVIYDMNTFQEIKRVSYYGIIQGSRIDISPDGQTLAVSVHKKPESSSDKNINQVLLIDTKKMDNYTVIETVESGVQSMEFSPDGTKLAYRFDAGNANTYIYIFDLVTKEKKYLKRQEFSDIFGVGILSFGTPKFIEKNTILIGCSDLSDEHKYYFAWNIPEHRIKNFISFMYNRSVSMKDSIVLLCNQDGILAYLNQNIVTVKDNEIENDYLSYRNNQLEYYSDKSFLGKLIVYDTTGKEISNLGTHFFVVGQNLIRVNQSLPIGTYILTIKNGTEQISKKFLVE